MPNRLPKPKASTQAHLDIEDITNDLVILKTGWVANVLATTAVNFDLLSEAEQDATIYAYGAFLNSLSFPLEILIRSKKADITSYFDSLEAAERTQPNPDLKLQIQKYQDFLQSTVQQRTVLDKKFYLIINFNPLEHGLKATLKNKSQLISEAKIGLTPKRDHIIAQTARLGLITRELTTQELIELFYDIYNPAPTGTQRVILDTGSYTTPLVEPAFEVPTPAPATSDVAPTPSGAEQASAGQSTVDPLRSRLSSTQAQSEASSLPASRGEQLTEANPITSPPSNPAEPVTNLRPVPPASTQRDEPAAQATALANLQNATARAAQILGKPTTQTGQSSSNNSSQPNAQINTNDQSMIK